MATCVLDGAPPASFMAARQRGLRLAAFAFMQDVTRPISGMADEQSRIASDVQAALCSGVPCAHAAALEPSIANKTRPPI